MLLAGAASLIGMFVQTRLRNKFRKYSQIPISTHMTGQEVAEAMLRFYNVQGVDITQGQGTLTDHYNPATKVVSLSPDIYAGRSIMAAAVAAHECGHAIQHDTGYSMLQLRSGLVPLVNIAAPLQQYLFMGALFVAGGGFGQTILLLAIVAFGVTALFALVTLPVEFDASRRALVWLKETKTVRGAEYEGAKDALWWAAMTYVAAALSALVGLIYLVLRYMGASDD
ncbi:MAG: zinc metallopeptidase [Bacteroidota bacterium]